MPIPESGCLLWMGRIGRDGYGDVNLNGKPVATHRFSWIKRYGEIPKGLYVLHTCDTKSCINTNHLFLGTQKDNMKDAAIKDKLSRKLTNQDVLHIVDLHNYGFSMYRIAKIYKVCKSTIRMTIKNRYSKFVEWGLV